jgi:hypothetical protein
MRHIGAVLFAAGTFVWSGCNGSFTSGEGTAGTTGTAGAKATAGIGGTSTATPPPATTPLIDDTPPVWLPPPDYTELAWAKATELIRSAQTCPIPLPLSLSASAAGRLTAVMDCA